MPINDDFSQPKDEFPFDPLNPGDIYSEMKRLSQAQDSPWGKLLGDGGEDSEMMDIISYIESAHGLGEGTSLYPIQKFILKLFRSMPLDDERDDIVIWDRFREVEEGRFTEKEFLRFLHEKDRCNVSPEEYEERIGNPYIDIVLRLGRRGTKTSLCSWLAAYTIYRLSFTKNPQKHYGFRQNQPIGIILISTREEQAQKLLAPSIESVKRSPTLRKYVVNPNNTTKLQMRFGDSENILERRSVLNVNALPCSAKSTLGDANIMVLLEEFGHFFFEDKSSNKSDAEVYKALDPSRADFRNPETGDPEGTMVVISTPSTKSSYMYKIEEEIWEKKRQGGLVIHIPSYWVNPQLSPQILHNAYNSDPADFDLKYGAEYVEGVSTALTKDIIENCWSDSIRDMGTLRRNETAFMGVDLGFTDDGSSISIVAANEELHCRLIHQEYHNIKMPEYLENGWTKVDIEVIAKRVDVLWERFSVHSGLADMWNLPGLIALLKSQARTSLEQVSTTQVENDHLARSFISTINQGRFEIYEDSSAWDEKKNFFSVSNELFHLERITTSGNPPKISLRASAGYHDDQYSSISRAIWAARKLFIVGGGSAGTVNNAQRQRSHALRSQAESLRNRAARVGDRAGNPYMRYSGR